MSTFLQEQFVQALKDHLGLCQEAMELAARENEALSARSDYQPFGFYQTRKNLLPRLQESLMALRKWRQSWQQGDALERAGCLEAGAFAVRSNPADESVIAGP